MSTILSTSLRRQYTDLTPYIGEDTPDVPSIARRLEDGREPEWTDFALCAETDPEAFFPEKGGSTRNAKMVCSRCPVRRECLETALDRDERFGIWGGLSERERRRLRRNVNPLHVLPEVNLDADDSPMTQAELDVEFSDEHTVDAA